jgi:hypothetical protein
MFCLPYEWLAVYIIVEQTSEEFSGLFELATEENVRQWNT